MTKRRPIAFLLLPILTFVFMAGWLLKYLSEKAAPTVASPKAPASQTFKQKAKDLEIGLLEELTQQEAIIQ